MPFSLLDLVKRASETFKGRVKTTYKTQMLKHSPHEFKSAMAVMATIVTKARYFPQAASEAMVTYTPKKGKDPSVIETQDP